MSANQKIIIILYGLTRADAAAALSVFDEIGGDSANVIIAPVTDTLISMNTGEAINMIADGQWPGGKALTDGPKSALIANSDKKNAVMISHSFKTVCGPKADLAFAMVTETGRTWTCKQYFSHIRKEHVFMKTANPEDDPDMREMDENE